VDPKTSLIDYDALAKQAQDFKPKLIIAGTSAYPRDLDYKRFREICDDVGAYLHADMAHVSGLVAAQEANDPFEYADVVTSTTHKSLRGPRSGIIFTTRKNDLNLKVDDAVFPGSISSAHLYKISALAAQLLQASKPEFKEYIRQVKANASAMADEFIKQGNTLVTGGTDNHLMLLSAKARGLTGTKLEKMCDAVHITLNKNTILGDKSAVTPGGVRIGTPAITTRGYLEDDARQVAQFIERAIQLSIKI
jgi:glycine hydroxymethyltransferase